MYCPSCRSEYRAGITDCHGCGVALVDALPELRRAVRDDDPTVAIGLGDGTLNVLEHEGKKVDLGRVFPLERAKELQSIVERAGVPTLLRERAELVFPDRKPRFELHVHADDRQTAEELLREAWAALVEADVAATPASIEECPACGANVPLDAEACPDCGLVVGRADDGGEDGPGDAP